MMESIQLLLFVLSAVQLYTNTIAATTAGYATTTTPPWVTETDGSITTAAYPETGTTAANPLPPAQNIPPPFTEVKLNAAMYGYDFMMTMPCLTQYSSQFKDSLKFELNIVKQEIQAGRLCGGLYNAALTTSYINMIAIGYEVLLEYGVNVVAYGTETLNEIESCSWQVGSFMSNFNNWRQPIWFDIYQCPRLVFSSSQFTLTEVSWQCPL